MSVSDEPKPALRLYNTLTRQKDPFKPIDPTNVRMYVCGPTVYDFAHIGNARPVIVFDVLFRLLKHLASQGVWDDGKGETVVTYARNITDVDDKINARARRDFPALPLNDAIRQVTESTNAQFQADVTALGCLPPTHQPRATDHIADMVAIIGRLLAKDYAYIAHGSEGREVLFDISRMKNYGALSNRKLDEQREGARVAVEAHKKHPGDFVLWKESHVDEPGWDAEFPGEAVYPANEGTVTIFGRPGWHIECSAMSMAKLLRPYGGGLTCDDPQKNTFDIHGGGIDLVFPHHENEIAQSCCAFGTDVMANVWMHNGFVQVEGRKMSKSDGNFITIDDLLNTTKFGGRSWPGEVLRLAMLKTHYRQPLDWTVRALEEAADELANWASHLDDDEVIDIVKKAHEEGKSHLIFENAISILIDDMNFADFLVFIRSKMGKIQRADFVERARILATLDFLGLLRPEKINVYHNGVVSVSISPHLAMQYKPQIVEIRTAIANNNMHRALEIINIIETDNIKIEIKINTGSVLLRGADNDLLQDINSLITLRNAARAARNWPESDRIRAELDAMGIALKDGKDEAGNPVSTWEVKR